MFQSIKTLIGSAYVDPIFLMPTGKDGSPDLSFFLMMGAMFLVLYFFMIRPQSKKAKEQKEFLGNIKKGDKIVTVGGIHGRIDKVTEDYFMVEIAPNTKVKLDKSVISLDLTKAVNQDNNGNKPKDK